MRRALAALALTAATACGSGDDDHLAVTDAWARSTPAVSVGAIYLRVTSPVDDELVGADVDASIADSVELHSTAVDSAGTATMSEQSSLPVPADGELALDPLGNHLMLVGLAAPLTAGETFDVTLHFATAGDVTTEVEVRDDAP